MNIESATIAKPAQINEIPASNSTTGVTNTKEDTKSFKEQLEATKSQDASAKTTETTDKNIETNNQKNPEEIQNNNKENVQNNQIKEAQKSAENNIIQQANKNQQAKNKDAAKDEIPLTLKELNSQIANLKEFKTDFNTAKSVEKTDNKISEKGDYCQRMKMDNNDITFFVNLVQNQQMSAQGNSPVSQQNINFTDVKTEATQQTVQVSQTLLNALNESVKTNKPFRIDFGNDVAVIMKVDKDGVISANFIPGSAAVENYLRNNIAGLMQNFDNQNLSYNELTYSKQQKQEQERQENKNKENKNE